MPHAPCGTTDRGRLSPGVQGRSAYPDSDASTPTVGHPPPTTTKTAHHSDFRTFRSNLWVACTRNSFVKVSRPASQPGAGCCHLVASIAGVVRVQGTVTGVRRVFHTRIEGVPVAGDRADVLARVAGSGVDEQVLAVRVACGPQVPPPVGERSFWRGVRALAPDHYLRIDRSGAVGEVRWWQPPEPEVPLTVGAGAVRHALETAVAARRPVPGRLSADLSGGMDSTSLCFLAARAGTPDLVTLRWAEADGANDDAVFAAHVASGLPQAEHVVLPQAEMPGIFADAGDTGDTEAPYRFTRTLARTRHSARVLAAHGAREHLAGHGGDELFHGPPAYLPSLLRRRPFTAITHLRGYRALHRWSLAATVSGMARCGDLGAWWHQQAQQLTTGPLPRRTPPLGWGLPLRAAVWVTQWQPRLPGPCCTPPASRPGPWQPTAANTSPWPSCG
jgi:asparagine synthase (glutamine-hydrolysing)